MDEIDDKLCLTKLKKIIGNHKRKKNQSKEYTSDFVSETSKFFISGGTNNEIIVYTKDSLIKIDNPYSPDDWVYNILENQENNFLVTEGTKIKLVKAKSEKNDSAIYTKVVLNSLLTLQIGEEFIVCCQNKVLLYNNKLIQWNNLDEKKVLYNNYTIKAAIKIDNFALLKSNKICSMGNDNIFIYNLVSHKRVYNELDEYSFVYSQNGLTILNIDIKNEKNNNIITKKILLCACKKYIENQKNGILLITNIEENNFQNIKDIDIKTNFFDTRDFEVYCFCPILILETSKILKVNNTKTNYFLVGGFEKTKNKGIIKLFKVIYSYEKSESRIKFIQDIEIISQNYSNKNKFIIKKPISCINQSSSGENFLVTCWDGNVYLLSNLNIETYLKYDKLIEKNISLNDLDQFHFFVN